MGYENVTSGEPEKIGDAGFLCKNCMVYAPNENGCDLQGISLSLCLSLARARSD